MRFGRIVLLTSIATLAACGTYSIPKPINDDYQLAMDDEKISQRLEDWLNCDECVNGQLRRIQELGNIAVPHLIDARNGVPIEVGGVAIMLADRDDILTARCTRLTTPLPGGTLPPGVTPAQTTTECIDRFKANRNRRLQGRATEALLAIRTQNACNELGTRRCTDLAAFFPPVYGITTDRSVREIEP
ncbi:MAG: hypothetical protein ACI88G_002059 [Woeseiaceae bacterium]|jgi:hypothetical protein